jgi:hypothetical protein
MTGTIEQVSEDLDRLAALGVGHVFWFMPGTEPDQQLDAMQELLAAIPG